jgi:hypothetical protein
LTDCVGCFIIFYEMRQKEHYGFLNRANLILKKNKLIEIQRSEFPYVLNRPAGMGYLDFVGYILAYFEGIEQFEICIELAQHLNEMQKIFKRYCSCEKPVYARVYKVRKPKCQGCQKHVLPPKYFE